MYVTRHAKTFTPLIELFVQLNQRDGAPIQGVTQKERQYADGRRRGYREGCVEGITAILNGQRCIFYTHWEMLPLLDAYEVEKVVKNAMERFQILETTLPSMPKTDEERARHKEATDKFYTDLLAEFNELAIGGDMAERELERHMKAVLAGEEDPTDADRPWLEERLAKARELNKEIEDLVKVITPKGRPIKDQPQA
jgi:hypothetical protein